VENCIFCKIIKGELPSNKIYEDDEFIAFQSLNQTAKGHSLLVPKEHSTDLLDMNSELGCKMTAVAQKIAKATMDGLGATGLNMSFNVRPAAGQVIFHTHMHIIPRYDNDGLKMWPEENVSEEDRILFASKIIKHLD